MRIMTDTNILISIAVFNSSSLDGILSYICLNHTLVLSSYILEEVQNVVKRKFPDKITNVNEFLARLPFELEYTPHELPKHNLFKIRDIKDEPILYSSITADVDIIITGDNDFAEVDIERPEYGKLFDIHNIRRMMRFADCYNRGCRGLITCRHGEI